MSESSAATQRVDVGRFVVLGALAGASLGIADLVDTIAGGFAGTLGGLGLVGVVWFAAVFHAAFGVLMGVAWAGLLGLGMRAGISASPIEGLVWGPVRLGRRRMFLALGAWILLLLGGFTALCLGAYPFGVPIRQLAIIVGPVLCVVVAIGARLAPVSRVARLLMWGLFIAGTYWMQARLVFQFSKNPPLNYVHSGGMLHLYGLVLLALTCETAGTGWRRMSRRVIVGVCVAAVMILLSSRPLLALGSHQARLVLHERTSLTYRLLWLLPDLDHSVSKAQRNSMCSPPLQSGSVSLAASRPLARGVVMIFVDSLRADRLDAETPDGAPLTPNMRRLASSGTSFAQAYTTSPSTRRALRSMVTGKFNGGWGNDLADDNSLGGVLQKNGIKTSAISAHKNTFFSLHMFDSYRMFEEEVSNRSSVTSKTSTEMASRELATFASDEPFFMFVHYYDPHAHYVPNEMFEFGGSEFDRYDAEVAYTDHWVGKLLDEIDANPAYHDVAVILVGDHGDEFWEHRYRRHLLRIYNEAVRVPMIVRVPHSPAGQRFDTPVSVADLYPTVLGLFGLEAPGRTLGRSLMGAVRGTEPPPARPIFLISHFQRSVAAIAGDQKVLINRAIGANEFYDLATDPGEQDNLADQNPERFNELYCALIGWLDNQPL